MWITMLGDLSPSANVPAESLVPLGFKPPSPAADPYTVVAPGNILDYLEEDALFLSATTFVVMCAGGELQLADQTLVEAPDDTMDFLEGVFSGESDDICSGGDLLTVTKRFRVSNQDDANRNTNPAIRFIDFDEKRLLPLDETDLPDSFDAQPGWLPDAGVDAGTGDGGVAAADAGVGAAVGVFVCETMDDCLGGVKISAKMTEQSFETYETIKFDKPEVVDEILFISWFVTGGEVTRDRSGVNPDDQTFNVKWKPPLEGGTHTLYAVAHDLRGGTSWRQYLISGVTPE
jgi:hypothetical protein